MDPKDKKNVDVIEDGTFDEDGEVDYISLELDPEDLGDELNFDDWDSDMAILNEEGYDKDIF